MAGENVQFEESQDKNCVKNLERWNNNRDQTGDRHSPQHCSKGEEVGIPPPPPHLQKLSYFGGWQVYDTHLYSTSHSPPPPSPQGRAGGSERGHLRGGHLTFSQMHAGILKPRRLG